MKLIGSDDVLEAPDASGIVHQMHERSFEKERSDFAYMCVVARRTEMQYGKPIRCGDPDDFIADLISVELLEKISN